ncbi:HEAT repeat protein [bacterium BMS3Bbin14]|nr:HEAT repeat protein [bacterium BMS3Abin13]GBE52753.1 HEAT repeat protein [bacterium BMS3Bbin14]
MSSKILRFNTTKTSILCVLVALLCILPTHAFSMRAASPDQTQAQIIVKEGKLTVSVNEVPLPIILMKLADQTGIGFEIYADIGLKISANFKDMPLDEGIKRLLKSSNHIIVYSENSKKNILPRTTHIVKIIITDNSGRNTNRPIMVHPAGSIHSNQRPGHLTSIPERIRKRMADIRKGRFPANPAGNKSAKSLEYYAELLKNSDPTIRENAVMDMADEYNEKAIPYLEDVLARDKDSDVRSNAAEEIGYLGGRDGIKALAKGLNDSDDEVRMAVVEALGTIGGAEVQPVLEKAMQDNNKEIRETAADLVKETEDEGQEMAVLPMEKLPPEILRRIQRHRSIK